MNDRDVVSLRECHDPLEEVVLHDGRRRIVRIPDEQDLSPPRVRFRDFVQVGEKTVLRT